MGDYKNHKNTLFYLKQIETQLNGLTNVSLRDLDIHQTAVITIDVINGFLKDGALSSKRIYNMLEKWVELHELTIGYQKVFFKDAHAEDAPEFKVYPEHCMSDDWQSEIVNELVPFISDDAWVIHKNSTNGFLTHEFMSWLAEHPEVDTFIILGDCTDLCIKQFALTLKAYFNENNARSRIIVPIEGTETFDLEVTHHDGNLMNLFSYYEMQSNGIEVIKNLEE